MQYAQRYADTIKEHHNKNKMPIHILGYCGGGPIAIEIARILEKSDIRKTLLLLETPNPYHDPKNSDLAQWLTTFFNGVFNLNLIVSDVREQYDNFDELFQYLFGLAVRQGEINKASFEVNIVQGMKLIVASNALICIVFLLET